MEYRIIEADDYEIAIEAQINTAMVEGWEPIGGVAVKYVEWKDGDGDAKSCTTFFRAMIRREV